MNNIEYLSDTDKMYLVCMYFARMKKDDERYKQRTYLLHILAEKLNKSYSSIKNIKDGYDSCFDYNGREGWKDNRIENNPKAKAILEKYGNYPLHEIETYINKFHKILVQENREMFISMRIAKPEQAHDIINGVKNVSIDGLYTLENELKENVKIFIVLGGDKGTNEVDWETGMFAFAHVSKAPYDKGYISDKPKYFKVDIEIDIVLKSPISKDLLMDYPDTYDAVFIGLEIHRDPTQAIASLDYKKAVGVVRAIIDIMPEYKKKLTEYLGYSFFTNVLDFANRKINIHVKYGEALSTALNRYLQCSNKSIDSDIKLKIDSIFADYISFKYWDENKVGGSREIYCVHGDYDYGKNKQNAYVFFRADSNNLKIFYNDTNVRKNTDSYGKVITYLCEENDDLINDHNDIRQSPRINSGIQYKRIIVNSKEYYVKLSGTFSERCSFLYKIITKYDKLENWFIGILRDNINVAYIENILNKQSENKINFKINESPLNLILYGAPGTGKSYRLENEYLGKEFAISEYCRRVTFYPAYTYSQFFGTYKPVSDNDIAYKYVAGPFLDTILDAKNNREQNYVLIIEEINRANVSAVFGDTFQLLDRDETGKSEYEITVSDELAEYAKEKGVTLINNKLGIPSNMYIWATMNSADQGVMPLDTAFKRRWDFEYIGINDGEDEIKDCTFTINNKKVNWNSLRKHINSLMATAEINEDKWLGPFFISKHILDKGDFKDTFKSKVLMYLFEDSARYEMEFIIKENYQKNCKTLSGLFNAFEKHDVDIFVGSENIEIETITDGEQ